MSKWDERFIALAQHVADWSKDPSTKVGAVISDSKHRIISLGFNGFPCGIEDDLSLPRDVKLSRTIHAEQNAILFAQRALDDCSIYITHPVCTHCAVQIIQAGIKRVVFADTDAAFSARWRAQIIEAVCLLDQAGVTVVWGNQ